MTTADEGGFDIAIEIAEDTLTFVAKSIPIPSISPQPINTNGLQGQISPKVTMDEVHLIAPDLLRIMLNLQGTNIVVNQITLNGINFQVPTWMQNVALGGTVSIDGLLQMQNNALVANFTDNAATGTPIISLNLDESGVLASPVIEFILAQAMLQDLANGTVYQQTKTEILQTINDQATSTVHSEATTIGVQTLIPPPSPPSPIAGVSSSDFKVGNQAIHVLYQTCGSGGNSALISRSNLLRRTSDGQPLDRAALILSNAGFLGCFVRPLIAAALGLTPVGFNPSHPFFWGGHVPLTIPGGPPTGVAGVFVNSMMAGIDGTNLRLLANIEADGVASAFTVTASVDMTFSFTAGIAGSSLTFTVAPLGTPSVQSNLSIAWWVYVAAFVVAGMTLDAVLAAIQAFGGSILNGPIARSIAIPSIPTVGIPLVGPPMTVRATSLGQADAPVRTITISLPVGSIAFPDQFRANDIIVNFV